MPAAPREQARAIWDAGVRAVDPFELTRAALSHANSSIRKAVLSAERILVFGGGKAGAAMAAGVEAALADRLDRVSGVINVPAESVRPLQTLRLHAARPAGTNFPTAEGVSGTAAQLHLAESAGKNDVGLCLISGGGSALLPAPVFETSLEAKQQVTRLLHSCGASINEMNCVRKHLSRYKGGGLARAFRGSELFSLILSDVVGDPLDVIASGPTAADPTTFADAVAVLKHYKLIDKTPPSVLEFLKNGQAGQHPETLKTLPSEVHNVIIGNNAHALAAAEAHAMTLGYRVFTLRSFMDGDTSELAEFLAAAVRSIRHGGNQLFAPPLCLLSGGETTVTLPPGHGKGGRNQELVLALLQKFGPGELVGLTILSGGTDGEDGPTDAAGAIADATTLRLADKLSLSIVDFLSRHDAYHFFEATGHLLKTGLTGTNVMDVRVILLN